MTCSACFEAPKRREKQKTGRFFDFTNYFTHRFPPHPPEKGFLHQDIGADRKVARGGRGGRGGGGSDPGLAAQRAAHTFPPRLGSLPPPPLLVSHPN